MNIRVGVFVVSAHFPKQAINMSGLLGSNQLTVKLIDADILPMRFWIGRLFHTEMLRKLPVLNLGDQRRYCY